jgi:hypothetical protein
LPNLYALMCKMYNQNPLRIHEKWKFYGAKICVCMESAG